MCASIETYANERAMDKVIITCFKLKQTTEETVKLIKEEFPEVDNDRITSRVTFLWNQKKGE